MGNGGHPLDPNQASNSGPPKASNFVFRVHPSSCEWFLRSALRYVAAMWHRQKKEEDRREHHPDRLGILRQQYRGRRYPSEAEVVN